ncbi:MAG: hypothetical protein ABIF77_13285 [bacterium]
MRLTIPRLIVGIVGSLLVLTPFFARPEAAGGHPLSRFFAYVDENFSIWFNILAVFAFFLGAASLLQSHFGRIRSRRRDWVYSVVCLVSFLAVLVIGLCKLGGPPGLQGDVAHAQSWLTWVFSNVYSPLKSTVYSLLAFFVASAAYRAFRLRSREATLLLVAAFIILLGRTPLGVTVTAWLPQPLHFLRIDELSVWIMNVPNTAGWRAILIGISLGVVATSLRLILGIERGAFGGRTR